MLGSFSFILFQKKLELSENLTKARCSAFLHSESAVKRPSSKDVEQENLRTLNRNKILTSIMGHNSVTNKQKVTGNNPNLDLVNVNI